MTPHSNRAVGLLRLFSHEVTSRRVPAVLHSAGLGFDPRPGIPRNLKKYATQPNTVTCQTVLSCHKMPPCTHFLRTQRQHKRHGNHAAYAALTDTPGRARNTTLDVLYVASKALMRCQWDREPRPLPAYQPTALAASLAGQAGATRLPKRERRRSA